MKEHAEKLGIKVDGRWSEARLMEEVMKKESEAQSEFSDATPVPQEPVDKFQTVEWASERASKMYAGQSPHLDMALRIGRIRAALKSRGYTRWDELVIDGAVDYQQYL